MIERILNRFGYFKRPVPGPVQPKKEFDKTGWIQWPLYYEWGRLNGFLPPDFEPILLMRDEWGSPMELQGRAYVHPATNIYGLWWKPVTKEKGEK